MAAKSLAARWRQTGVTAAHVAKKLKVHRTTVSRVIAGEIKAPDLRIARAIVKVVGSTVEAEFPALTKPTPSIRRASRPARGAA
jgi:DNA-binding XRE family transcriptional regulator